MSNEVIPNADHLIRYVGGRFVDQGEEGSPVIDGAGFLARPKKENNRPSFNWLEKFAGDDAERLDSIRGVSRLIYGATAKLVKLNVGSAKTEVFEHASNHEIEVISDPLMEEGGFPADPSHALMTNIPDLNDPYGDLIGDILARCILEIFPARK